MTTKQELKKLFENGDKPTQENFWEWMDSYWHKDEKLNIANINSLQNQLNNKLDYAELLFGIAELSDDDEIFFFENLQKILAERGKKIAILHTLLLNADEDEENIFNRQLVINEAGDVATKPFINIPVPERDGEYILKSENGKIFWDRK